MALSGCVTTGRFKEQVARTEAAQKHADETLSQLNDAQRELTDARKKIAEEQGVIDSDRAQLVDLQAKVKAGEEQLAAMQRSNKVLTDSMDASKNALQKKVSELVKEKDDLSRKISDLTRSMNDQLADLNTKVAHLQAEKDALQKEKDDELARVKKNYDEITAGLKSEIEKGSVQISQLKGRLTLNVVDKVLFATGQASLNEQGRAVLDQIGEVLKTLHDKDVRIEGHTDNVPIAGDLTSRFATNWELSTARATAVARYLQDKDGVDPQHLVAAGYGEYRPVAPNDTPENRALNRRIEIVLVPRE
jgi:chemotaxis protein MotB